jgi:hypothetical protein
MLLFIECVEHYITLGEICNTLRGVWGSMWQRGFSLVGKPASNKLGDGLTELYNLESDFF